MAEEKEGLDTDQIKELIKAHLAAEEPECRWCFAVDMHRVKGKEISRFVFPDAVLVLLSCPRCGGVFSYYAETWEGDYLRNIISKLHPELGSDLDEESFEKMNDRVFPEYLGV